MVDLFEEVEESLRADRMRAAWRRSAPWVLGLVFGAIVIGGGLIGWRYWDENRAARASEAFMKVLEEGGGGDAESAFQAFEDIAKKGPPAYKSLALMHQAGIRLEQKRDKDAADLFEKAAKAAPRGKAGLVLADSARLKSALALMDDAPYAETEARLKPLAEEGRPYRAVAREALAIAKLNAGQAQQARADFLSLSADLTAPQGISARAKAAVALIDNGSATVIPAAVKTAKTTQPPAPSPSQGIPPEILEQLKAQGIQLPEAPAQ